MAEGGGDAIQLTRGRRDGVSEGWNREKLGDYTECRVWGSEWGPKKCADAVARGYKDLFRTFHLSSLLLDESRADKNRKIAEKVKSSALKYLNFVGVNNICDTSVYTSRESSETGEK
ncbi:hypothetical protein AAMO2058_000951000 [Amorphochlora amoebiformis]